MVLAQRDFTQTQNAFLRDDAATEQLRVTTDHLNKLREQDDGVYSRALARAIFGVPDEAIDELGWAR